MQIEKDVLDRLVQEVDRGAVPFRPDMRDSLRISMGGRLTIIPLSAANRSPTRVAVRDLSKSGIGILHAKAMIAGDEFLLCVPGDTRHAFFCRVSYCREIREGTYAIGASFQRAITTAVAVNDVGLLRGAPLTASDRIEVEQLQKRLAQAISGAAL